MTEAQAVELIAAVKGVGWMVWLVGIQLMVICGVLVFKKFNR